MVVLIRGCLLYSIPVIPNFLTLKCIKKPTLALNIWKFHYFIFLEIDYLDYELDRHFKLIRIRI